MSLKTSVSKKEHKPEYISTIIVNFLIYWIFNRVVEWENIPFIKNGFEDLLGFFNLTIKANIIGNLILLANDRNGLREVVKIVLNFLSIVFMVFVIRGFPFDFSMINGAIWLNSLVKVVMTLGIFGSSVAIVVEIVRFIKKLDRNSFTK